MIQNLQSKENENHEISKDSDDTFWEPWVANEESVKLIKDIQTSNKDRKLEKSTSEVVNLEESNIQKAVSLGLSSLMKTPIEINSHGSLDIWLSNPDHIDALNFLSFFKLSNFGCLRLQHIKGRNDLVNEFLKRSFPSSIKSFCFVWNNQIERFDFDIYF